MRVRLMRELLQASPGPSSTIPDEALAVSRRTNFYTFNLEALELPVRRHLATNARP
jgi:hypothetical protein